MGKNFLKRKLTNGTGISPSVNRGSYIKYKMYEAEKTISRVHSSQNGRKSVLAMLHSQKGLIS